jgi:hypothetical protein
MCGTFRLGQLQQEGDEMVEGNEIIVLFLGMMTFWFIQANRTRLRRLPAGGVLTTGFYLFLASWGFTVIEGFFWWPFFNFLEHTSCAVGSMMIVVWSWKVFGKTERSP